MPIHFNWYEGQLHELEAASLVTGRLLGRAGSIQARSLHVHTHSTAIVLTTVIDQSMQCIQYAGRPSRLILRLQALFDECSPLLRRHAVVMSTLFLQVRPASKLGTQIRRRTSYDLFPLSFVHQPAAHPHHLFAIPECNWWR